MEKMFKISHERATSNTRDLTAQNHISALIGHFEEPPKFRPLNKVSKIVSRFNRPSIIIFSVAGKTWWVNQVEFNTWKYALENTTTYIRVWYNTGSDSPFRQMSSGNNTPFINGSNSALDGYELLIEFT